MNALCGVWEPEGLEGPSEAAHWTKQFFKARTPDEDLLKDRVAAELVAGVQDGTFNILIDSY